MAASLRIPASPFFTFIDALEKLCQRFFSELMHQGAPQGPAEERRPCLVLALKKTPLSRAGLNRASLKNNSSFPLAVYFPSPLTTSYSLFLTFSRGEKQAGHDVYSVLSFSFSFNA